MFCYGGELSLWEELTFNLNLNLHLSLQSVWSRKHGAQKLQKYRKKARVERENESAEAV